MQIGLVISLVVLVLIAGAAICVGWWKLADRWFPGTSRKTGQEIRLTRRRGGAEGGAKVIRLEHDD